MENRKYKFVVIGAGLCGLSTAYELAKAFPGNVLVIEKEDAVGGLCRTLTRHGGRYDLGSHRIHPDVGERALGLIQEICPHSIIRNIRAGKLRLKRAYIDYPLKPVELILGLGFIESSLCALSLAKNALYHIGKRDRASEGRNYEKYLIRKAGLRGYRLFYEPYARKVWGLEPSLISPDAVKKRISTAKPADFLKDTFKKDNRRFYYYLQEGMGSLAAGMEEQLLQRDCRVVKNIRDFSINADSSKTINFSDGHTEYRAEFEVLISTISLASLVTKLNPQKTILQAATRLTWRSLRLTYVHMRGDLAMQGESFYFPELRYPFGRVSVPKRFSPLVQPDNGYTALTCEIPCSHGDQTWHSPDDQMYSVCRRGLREAGLMENNQHDTPEKDFIIDIPEVYPVYTIGYKNDLSLILEYLSDQFPYIYTSGKLGFFLHCNLDHAIDIGIALAGYVAEGKSSRDWHTRRSIFQNMKLRD